MDKCFVSAECHQHVWIGFIFSIRKLALHAGDLLDFLHIYTVRDQLKLIPYFLIFGVGPGCTNYWTWLDGVFRVIECLVDKQRQQISWTAGSPALIVSAADGRSGVNVWPLFSNQDELPAQWILTAADKGGPPQNCFL